MMQSMNEEMLAVMQEEDQNSLEHYGVKGQKWGQRNYQNPDGTYTELGKERRRVKFIREEKAKLEDANAHKNGIAESIDTESEAAEVKIGGKAYKDMTRKELRAAKKRARHNEAERRATREFNRDKREALENGDLSFISKNINKFTNEEIDDAMFRFKKMQELKNLETANRKDASYYMDKASKFLNKAENIITPITNISNKINEASKKASEKRNQQINEEKNSLDLLWKKNPKDRPLSKMEEEELRNKKNLADTQAAMRDKNRAQADQARDERELKKYTADLLKEQMKEQRDNEKAIKQEVKEARQRLAEQKKRKDDADAAWKEAVLKEELKAKEEQEKQAAKLRKQAEKDAEKAEKEAKKAREEYERYQQQEKENYKLYKEAMEEYEKQAEELAIRNRDFGPSNEKVSKSMAEIYKDDDDSYNWGWFGSSKKSKKESQNKDFDPDDERINGITKKYVTKLKNNSDKKNYWKENPTRTEKWKKDLQKRDADVIDDWVKDMKKKYMKEQKLDSKAAEAKAEAYVDSWLNAYDEGLF